MNVCIITLLWYFMDYLPIWVEPSGTVRVKCPSHEHNTITLARIQTQASYWCGVQSTKHLANAPSTVFQNAYATFYLDFAEIKVSFSTSLTFVVDAWTQLAHVVNQLQLTAELVFWLTKIGVCTRLWTSSTEKLIKPHNILTFEFHVFFRKQLFSFSFFLQI